MISAVTNASKQKALGLTPPANEKSDTTIEVLGARGAQVMALVRDLGFNARDVATWDALDMDAVTCWDQERLVGAIPYERRTLQLEPGRLLGTAHETVVGLHPDHRGGGLGSRMQQEFADHPPPGVEALTVFREKPESGAYRWYRANGFEPVTRIYSRLLDDPSSVSATTPIEIHNLGSSPGTLQWSTVDELRVSVFDSQSGGHIHRPSRDLETWLRVHPYRGSYRFIVAALGDVAAPQALAVCGIGRLHSQGERLEILELASPGWEAESAAALVRGLCRHAAVNDLAPVRWALSETDPFCAIAEELGITKRWSFEMLLRSMVGSVSASELRELAAATPWRYQALDYI